MKTSMGFWDPDVAVLCHAPEVAGKFSYEASASGFRGLYFCSGSELQDPEWVFTAYRLLGVSVSALWD